MINILDLHNFKSALPGLDVFNTPQATPRCYLCICVCECISPLHESISICKLLLRKWVLTSWYLMFIRALAHYTENGRKTWQQFYIIKLEKGDTHTRTHMGASYQLFTQCNKCTHEDRIKSTGCAHFLLRSINVPVVIRAAWTDNKHGGSSQTFSFVTSASCEPTEGDYNCLCAKKKRQLWRRSPHLVTHTPTSSRN